jgi:hypothetical protein
MRNRLGIKKVREYIEDRKLNWLKNHHNSIYGSTLGIPLGFYKKLGIPIGTSLRYSVIAVLPNKFIIELKKDDVQ